VTCAYTYWDTAGNSRLCSEPGGHAHCGRCGCVIGPDLTICPHHLGEEAPDWSVENRAYCDFIHRAQQLKPLPEAFVDYSETGE
jgi:hypothetical protein